MFGQDFEPPQSPHAVVHAVDYQQYYSARHQSRTLFLAYGYLSKIGRLDIDISFCEGRPFLEGITNLSSADP